MCLAIYKPGQLKIAEKALRCGFESNNDGCGLAWADNGKLHTEKGMFTWDAFLGLYQQHEQHPMLIHFRKSTHGKKNADNCHPFVFNDEKLALIHNGVLPIKCSEGDYSDTWHLVYKVLEPLIKGQGCAIDDSALSWLIKCAIGTDKIAVMDQSGEGIIFNEDKGTWEDAESLVEGEKGKVWFSNLSFRNDAWDKRSRAWAPGSGSTNSHTPNYHSHIADAGASTETGDWAGYGYAERLSDAAETPLGGCNDIEIATDENRKPGCMTEYGWFDSEIEAEIEAAKKKTGMQREDALIFVFNNA